MMRSLRWLLPLLLIATASAGGPRYVTGVTGFPEAAPGKPIRWANGSVVYYTDQGALSPVLDHSAANAFVADAFSRWTSVPTAALTANRAGALDQDVSGTNVTSSGGNISLPADIQPTSTKPLAVVYDADGAVTEILLGAGSSDPSLCRSHAAYASIDKFTLDGHFAHALIVINGRCAQTAQQLPDLKFFLIRAIGRALGLDWSQTNQPVASAALLGDQSLSARLGFPLMHPAGPFCDEGAFISDCLEQSDTLRIDDRAAISRLYPVTPENLASFSGKQLLAPTTARIKGKLRFRLPSGAPGQGIQGIHVTAYWIDPATGLPSSQYAASSVSGFLFRGNAGNSVTGFNASQTYRFDAFGASDPELEGFYDLAGLELPPGHSQGSFRLVFETVVYAGQKSVGPYRDAVVSGPEFPPVTVGPVQIGDDVTQDIVMSQALTPRDAHEPTGFQLPARLPSSGGWRGSISDYGDEDFYRLTVKAGRTMAIRVTTNYSLETLLQPMIGIWSLDAAIGSAPLLAASPFNSATNGVTELNATINSAGTIKIGIADLRGDGRPDFLYRAHVLYADDVSPKRVALAGTPLTITGTGFRRGMTVSIGGTNVSIVSIQENRIVVNLPAMVGTKDVVVNDPATGASTTIFQGVHIGPRGTDTVQVVHGGDQIVVPGTTSQLPVIFRVTDSSGTPVQLASVQLLASPATATLTSCSNATGCTLFTNAAGEVSTHVNVNAAADHLITASLSSGGITQTAAVGFSSGSVQVIAPRPSIFLPVGATASVPLTFKVMAGGAPAGSAAVSFSVVFGSGSLSASAGSTNSAGDVTTTVTLTNLQSQTTVRACHNGSSPCANVLLLPIAASDLRPEFISGANQTLPIGATPQAVGVRVLTIAGDPVRSVPLSIVTTVLPPRGAGDCNPQSGTCEPTSQRIIASSTTLLTTDANGSVALTPQLQASWGACRVVIFVYQAGTKVLATEWAIIRPSP